MEKNKNWILGLSAVMGSAYCIYWLFHISSASASASNVWETIGVGIGIGLVAPHLICAFLAVVFNILGFAIGQKWLALTGGILYSLSGIFYIGYLPFVVVQATLSFIGFAELHKAQNSGADEQHVSTHYNSPVATGGMSLYAFIASTTFAIAISAAGIVAMMIWSWWGLVLVGAGIGVLTIIYNKV